MNLTEVPEGDWLCGQCFTTPAHLPLGGPPDNNTVPSEEGILWLYIGSCMVSIHLHALCFVLSQPLNIPSCRQLELTAKGVIMTPQKDCEKTVPRLYKDSLRMQPCW